MCYDLFNDGKIKFKFWLCFVVWWVSVVKGIEDMWLMLFFNFWFIVVYGDVEFSVDGICFN